MEFTSFFLWFSVQLFGSDVHPVPPQKNDSPRRRLSKERSLGETGGKKIDQCPHKSRGAPGGPKKIGGKKFAKKKEPKIIPQPLAGPKGFGGTTLPPPPGGGAPGGPKKIGGKKFAKKKEPKIIPQPLAGPKGFGGTTLPPPRGGTPPPDRELKLESSLTWVDLYYGGGCYPNALPPELPQMQGLLSGGMARGRHLFPQRVNIFIAAGVDEVDGDAGIGLDRLPQHAADKTVGGQGAVRRDRRGQGRSEVGEVLLGKTSDDDNPPKRWLVSWSQWITCSFVCVKA